MAVALDVISKFLFENDMLIYLVVFGRTEYLTGRKLFSDVQEYIDDVYAANHYHPNAEARRRELWQVDEAAAQRYEAELFDSAILPEAPIIAGSAKPDWSKVFEEADEGFSEALLRLIDEKGMRKPSARRRRAMTSLTLCGRTRAYLPIPVILTDSFRSSPKRACCLRSNETASSRGAIAS